MRGWASVRLGAYLLLGLIPVFQPLSAQELSGIPGAYVDVGLGIRPLGMGGAYVAVAEDEAATRWNPAALANQQRSSAGFTWTRQMNLIPYNYLSGTFPLRQKGLGYYVEASGDDVLSENTIAIGYGTRANFLTNRGGNNLSIGITAKLRWASFGNNPDGGVGQVTGDAIGYGFDFGLYYSAPMMQGLTAGVMLRDGLNNISWNSSSSGQYDESVPTTLAMGLAYRPGRRVLLALDLQPALYSDVYTRLAVGAEYKLLKVIALRAGASQNLGSSRPYRDVTTGLGVDVPIFGTATLEAGVSYLFDELVNTPRVGLAIRW